MEYTPALYRLPHPKRRLRQKSNMWHTDQVSTGFITGAVCVWLLARQNIWNWPIGIANNIFYIVVFLKSGLYGDSGLQVVYIALAAYGWWLCFSHRPGIPNYLSPASNSGSGSSQSQR